MLCEGIIYFSDVPNRKDSTSLGEQWKKGVPIEVVPMAYRPVQMKLESLLGGEAVLREAKAKAVSCIAYYSIWKILIEYWYNYFYELFRNMFLLCSLFVAFSFDIIKLCRFLLSCEFGFMCMHLYVEFYSAMSCPWMKLFTPRAL